MSDRDTLADIIEEFMGEVGEFRSYDLADRIQRRQADPLSQVAWMRPIVQAAKDIIDLYPNADQHINRKVVTERHPAGTCQWCGMVWPCPTARLVDALKDAE